MNITITSGTVSKDGEEIGQIIGNECFSFRVIGPTVKAAINKAHGSKLKHSIDPTQSIGQKTVALIATIKDNAPGAPSGQTENTEGDSTSGKPVEGSSTTVAPEVFVASDPVASIISTPDEQNQKAPISPKPEIRQDLPESRELPVVPIEQAPQTPTQGAVAVAFGLPRLLALADAGKIPAPPKHHPAMGDKAPDFVQWFQAHATADEVNAKYPPSRRIPASFADYERAERERLNRKLKGEKKDTAPSQDFADADGE